MKLNILIPTAGEKTFKVSENNAFPRLLTDINGKLLVERAAAPFVSLPYDKTIIVAAPKEQIESYKLDSVLSLLDDSIEVCPVNDKTRGAVCSALLTVEMLDLDAPLIISSFEQILDLDLLTYIEQFISMDVDAGVLTFESIHPKWSYVKVDNHKLVTQAAEKRPISKNAIAGIYYFKKASLFIEAAKNMIRNDVTHEGMFYISHTLNEVILNSGRVLALPIKPSQYFHINDDHSLDSYGEKVIAADAFKGSMIYKLTQDYIDAFNNCSLSDISNLLSDQFILNDPSVSVEGKDNVLEYIHSIFDNSSQISFVGKNIIAGHGKSVIEFELTVGDKYYIGTDVITWGDDNKMLLMNAYLNEKV